ncbi:MULTISPECIES: DNA-directed RNA polymerase subunit omega [Corynebacterium]|uniref:DNA-directed RNA polymerase subunit omega n=2 Tax=Corynebacterium TaxID=1716 RepID=A0AAP4BWS8_9CORY|nr:MULTISPECIES: DNA-directed RNA polymerase subunit omega [Corynebacterium]MCG7233019.1 DNA-directed RNA polymerase subunit omega [Corynebacterium sp. ACRPR]MCG7242412.1 DNA-directed RNA polymerase subunit omega [Corynebacterium sp. ACRPS]MCG7270807.1 DNA-directed RNA polymerase subunit omega [Corynebacterium sp. ACRQM]EEI13559.1 DNA-directed RNA polymerase, omega subunit [Corynebacterium accolens ATCC 49725]EFM43483.1 DNA-directed RNA polymerase, omega subunit [Corynebacterium accolens ATCC 
MTNVTTPSNTESAKSEPVFDDPIGITDPPIDELLDKVSSKYALVIFAAKRARQINSYYQEQDEGVFEFVGPLVNPEPGEKPLSIALREIDAGLLDHEEGK